MPTRRERISESLLHTGIELAADRERMARSMRNTAPDQRGYELASSAMLTAQWVDSTILWLSVRLRPKSTLHPR